MNLKDAVSTLIAIQAREHMSDSQFAETIGYKSRVSWQRIKSRRFPMNDKLLARAAKRWPEMRVFLSKDATNHGEVASPDSHQTQQGKNLGVLWRLLRVLGVRP